MNRRFAIIALAFAAAACRKPDGQQPASTTPADTGWVASAAIYEVFIQDFSPQGNLRGVMDGLGRIDSAGANVVWLMPIHPYGVKNRKDPLGSPYAVRDYRAVNPAFGSYDDLRALVNAAHARGMKVILDWVPDHTAWDHEWITAHPDWYVHNERGEISVPRDASGRLTDWTDVAQLDYTNPALRTEMIATMRWWLEEFGLDGFRVDVAGFVPNDFWREAVPALRSSVNRRILLLAEWGDRELNRIGYDLTYGWDGYSRLKNIWGGAPASGFVAAEMADADSGGVRLRFSTNHDETAWDNPPVVRFTNAAGARAAFVTMALLPGRPMLYNGQEVESPQKLPLFDRQAVAWEQPNADSTRAFYRRVLALARTDSSFITAPLRPATTSAPNDLISYARGDRVVVVNTRNRLVRATLSGTVAGDARDLLSGRPQADTKLALPPFGAVVLSGVTTQARE